MSMSKGRRLAQFPDVGVTKDKPEVIYDDQSILSGLMGVGYNTIAISGDITPYSDGSVDNGGIPIFSEISVELKYGNIFQRLSFVIGFNNQSDYVLSIKENIGKSLFADKIRLIYGAYAKNGIFIQLYLKSSAYMKYTVKNFSDNNIELVNPYLMNLIPQNYNSVIRNVKNSSIKTPSIDFEIDNGYATINGSKVVTEAMLEDGNNQETIIDGGDI